MKKNRYALALVLALASCSTTKYVGDGSYLLTKVTIQVDSLDQTEREQLGDLEGKDAGQYCYPEWTPRSGLHVDGDQV